MSDHTFRNPDKFQVLSHREWIREKCPGGSSGFVAEDLDLLIRTYGFRFGSDAAGKFMLCELKFGQATPGKAQKNTFRLVDLLCKKGNEALGERRYWGYFLIQHPCEDWYECPSFQINSVIVSPDQLQQFFCFDAAMLSFIASNGSDPLA